MTKNRLGTIKLFKHQVEAIDKLRTGSILCGGVGSGKSLTALAYYYINKKFGVDLYIITTARKRDTLEWEREFEFLDLSNIQITVDSWNNIKKYTEVKYSFFIFDEQRVIGSGIWVRSFLKITKNNEWILLTATPGDTWLDYIPVFLANGFYKNRTEFIKRHVVYNPFVKFPKVRRYLEVDRLEKMKKYITVTMDYKRETKIKKENILASFDENKYVTVIKNRWNPYTNKPIKNVSELFFTMRKVVNSDISRLAIIQTLVDRHLKIIVFYNFNYELEILKELKRFPEIEVAEYNGHKHEPIPSGNKWAYLVQYMSGGEGWNCVETNAIAFYSQNYSYRMMTQAAGRIDRLNTPFSTLYYYNIISNSSIDLAIKKALENKKNFNEKTFERSLKL